ncbi:MAG: helix-turn-helix domain-containing protein [Bacilli bacterium]
MNDKKTQRALNVNNFGLNLYKVRNNQKITVEKLAEMLDVSTRIIYDWESGKKIPTFPRAVEIANVLRVSLDSILC